MRPGSLIALVAFVAALTVAPQAASAQSIAYAVPGSTNVRAGPGTQYPVVARVRGGTELLVYGCLSGRAWCDVQVYRTRGWMSSRRLEFVYAGSRVLVPEYYSYFDAPIISFNFGYWDRHYDDRPFYRRWRRDRDHRPRYNDDGPNYDGATNWPGIERPGGQVYQDPPQVFEQPQGPYDGGLQPPSVSDATPPNVGEGIPGQQMPQGVCPPDVVCQ